MGKFWKLLAGTVWNLGVSPWALSLKECASALINWEYLKTGCRQQSWPMCWSGPVCSSALSLDSSFQGHSWSLFGGVHCWLMKRTDLSYLEPKRNHWTVAHWVGRGSKTGYSLLPLLWRSVLDSAMVGITGIHGSVPTALGKLLGWQSLLGMP